MLHVILRMEDVAVSLAGEVADVIKVISSLICIILFSYQYNEQATDE